MKAGEQSCAMGADAIQFSHVPGPDEDSLVWPKRGEGHGLMDAQEVPEGIRHVPPARYVINSAQG